MRNRGIFIVFIVLAVAASIALKLYYAKICSLYICIDTAITGLMARDILRGDIPLFFYGGFYTWPLESWVMTLFFFLFGVSNCTVYIGPVFASMIFLVTIYLLGKEFKNSKVGFYAFLYSLFPPFYFFKFHVIPTGYLSIFPILGNIILLITLKILYSASFRKGIFLFVILGILSAAAFWVHYIALYYLCAAGAFLFLNMLAGRRFKYYLFGAAAGLAAFFAVGAPFWIFNLRHDFISFKFSGGRTSYDFLFGLKRFVTYQIPGILGNDIFTIAIFVSALVFLAAGLWSGKKGYINKSWLFILCFVFMGILFPLGGSFAVSQDFRYIIPVYSLIPVVIACFLDFLDKRIRRLGMVILTLLIVINLYHISVNIPRDKAGFEPAGKEYNDLIDCMIENDIDGAFGFFKNAAAISFMGNDRIYAAEVINSATPYDEYVMRSERSAYINCDMLKPIFDMLCESYKTEQAGGFNLIYNFKPHSYYGEEILPSGWGVRTNYNNNDAEFSFDRNLDKYWSSVEPRQKGMWFEIKFPHLYTIYKIQVFNMPEHYENLPVKYRMLVSVDGRNWQNILENTAAGIFWAGPHILWKNEGGLWEVIVPPVDARYLKIEYTGKLDSRYPWEINEIRVYKYLGEKQYSYKDAVYNAKKVYRFLKDKKSKFVYANLWMSEKLRQWSKGSIRALRIKNNFWLNRPDTSGFMNLDADAVIVVSVENEDAVRGILLETGIDFAASKIGDYVCFYFPENVSDINLLKKIKGLYWTENGIANINLNNLGRVLAGSSVNPLKFYSGNTQVYLDLYEYYKKNGLEDEVKTLKKIIDHKFIPKFKTRIEFSDGVEFLGWSMTGKKLKPGNVFKINYFWKIHNELQDITKDIIFVFVHFNKNGKIVFQNDHPLLEDYTRPHAKLKGGVWKESYMVKIPENAPCGEYMIKLGLWVPSINKRLDIKGTRSSAARIGKISIEE